MEEKESAGERSIMEVAEGEEPRIVFMRGSVVVGPNEWKS